MKMLSRFIYMLSALWCMLSYTDASELEAPSYISEKIFPGMNLIELRLSNGLVVWLKPTPFESDEVFLKVGAKGGFACLPPSEWHSGEFASQIAWESGLGNFSSEQLSAYLLDHSIEFEPKVQAFSRVIEGNTDLSGLDSLLHLVRDVFIATRFTREGWKTATTSAKDSLGMMAADYEYAYEAALLKVNSQGLPIFQPMAVEDLERVDFDVAEKFYRQAFRDPGEFVCVITGKFDMVSIKALILNTLGKIPKQEKGLNFFSECRAKFPEGITQKEINLYRNAEEALTRLTFPLKGPLNEKTMNEVAFVCQVIEARLRSVIINKMNLSYGIDVSYEFPFYPFLDHPWISIRYRCTSRLVDSLKSLVIEELEHLQKIGVSEEEIREIKRLEAASDEFWLKDNYYWTSMLTSYYLWNWNPEWIHMGSTAIQNLPLQQLNLILQTFISLSNYSIVTAKP